MKKIILISISSIILVLIILFVIVNYMTSESNPNFQQVLKQVEKENPGTVAPSSVDISLIPMYGGFSKTNQQKRTDQEFIDTVMKSFDSRELASDYTITKAREVFEKGDLNTAMRRYNQAWLLNESNPDVYIGFGDIYKANGYQTESNTMYELAEKYKQ